MMKKTYGYGRVSTGNQHDNTSLGNQKKAIEDIAKHIILN
jgi:DNA invertase Pin-like site-specific DNA recombinase